MGFAGRGEVSYRTAVPLQPGLAGSVSLVVGEADTASALASGDVPMLGTPRVVALVEEASMAALAGALEPPSTTVGMRVELSHLIPVPVGRSVRAEATLERVEGRRLVFTVSVTNEQGLVAVGKLTRVVVNRDRFVEKAV
jgi:fluoroacetyl-CoA thioesterase